MYKLKLHRRMHSGQGLYKCDQCGRSFNSSGNCGRHKRIHTGDKPFKCDQCGKCFTQSNALKRHERTHARDDCNQSTAQDIRGLGAAKTSGQGKRAIILWQKRHTSVKNILRVSLQLGFLRAITRGCMQERQTQRRKLISAVSVTSALAIQGILNDITEHTRERSLMRANNVESVLAHQQI